MNKKSKEEEFRDRFIREFLEKEGLEKIIFNSDNMSILSGREEEIIVSAIQWIGSPAGEKFLNRCGFFRVDDLLEEKVRKEKNQLIKKFQNGNKLYNTNSIFHYVIHKLLYGATFYSIIESLIEIIQKMSKVNTDLIIKNQIDLRQNPITPEEAYQLKSVLGIKIENPDALLSKNE